MATKERAAQKTIQDLLANNGAFNDAYVTVVEGTGNIVIVGRDSQVFDKASKHWKPKAGTAPANIEKKPEAGTAPANIIKVHDILENNGFTGLEISAGNSVTLDLNDQAILNNITALATAQNALIPGSSQANGVPQQKASIAIA